MKKWGISAVIYLLIVIGGYMLYAEVIPKDESKSDEANKSEHVHGSEKAAGHEDAHTDKRSEADSHSEHSSIESEVDVEVSYQQSFVNIRLKDSSGNPVKELEVNHEKLMHLIVVDEQLEKYYHVHPEKKGEGEYEVSLDLPDGSYKVFVDIEPKELNYAIKPLKLQVGSSQPHARSLKPDKELTKEIDGKKVSLQMNTKEAKEPVSLHFELDTSNLEPYLGAMGHVVILDEQAENFLHVHPEENDQPIFGTEFDKPGVYKIWAEFKQDGEVRAFPFVVEIN